MMNIIAELEKKATEVDVDFHYFFWQRSLFLRGLLNENRFDKDEAVSIPRSLLPTVETFSKFAQDNFPNIRESFFDILISQKTASIMWCLYCTPSLDDSSRSILTMVSPLIAQLACVIRVGPNIYKLNGWIVHILIGYGIATEYIPRGVPPRSLDWPPAVKQCFNDRLRALYQALDGVERAILHVGMFAHDIGVSVDITDHNAHGVPLVAAFLKDLGIGTELLASRLGGITQEDFVWAIESVVAFHTFISRVGCEYSMKRSAREVQELTKSASFSSWRQMYLKKSFAPILLIVTTGDVVAVSDELLTSQRVTELEKGYTILSNLMRGETVEYEETEEGLARFRMFLNDRYQDTPRSNLEQELGNLGYPAEEFWSKFWNVQEFNFTLSLIPSLQEIENTLLTFVLIFRYIDRAIGPDRISYQSTQIVFDHRIEPEAFENQIRKIKVHHLDWPAGVMNGSKAQLGNIEMTVSNKGPDYVISVRLILENPGDNQ